MKTRAHPLGMSESVPASEFARSEEGAAPASNKQTCSCESHASLSLSLSRVCVCRPLMVARLLVAKSGCYARSQEQTREFAKV